MWQDYEMLEFDWLLEQVSEQAIDQLYQFQAKVVQSADLELVVFS